jgi:hypothetical protein
MEEPVMIRWVRFAAVLGCFLGVAWLLRAGEQGREERLPKPGTITVNKDRGEVILSAVVKYPKGKPCIDEYDGRIQAFVGCARAAGGDAKMAGYFVFLVDVPTEEVYKGLVALGARTRVHYSMQRGHDLEGLTPKTGPKDYLQGDPVVLSVFWKDGERWVERPYQDFVTERVLVEGKPVEKPWTPSFVFHGSGAIHKSGTGCIACPCDCPGGIIADNRFPVYEPKPLVKFHMERAPRPGTPVYVRIRCVTTR